MRLFEAYDKKRAELNDQADKLSNSLKQLSSPVLDPELTDAALISACRDGLAERFDSAEGGFGRSMKFAMPGSIDRLLNHWAYRASRQWHGQRNAGNGDDDIDSDREGRRF